MKSPLTDKIVRIAPVERDRGFLPKGHDGYHMFTGAKKQYCLPEISKNRFVSILTEEEREYLESPECGLGVKPGDLAAIKKSTSFWNNFYVSIDKNGLVLNLKDPLDFLQYKVLLSNTKSIAPSYKERLDKASYIFMIVEDSEEEELTISKAEITKKVWIEYGKMESSISKLSNFLTIYSEGKQIPAKNTPLTALQTAVLKTIEDDPKGFLTRISDVNYVMKGFVIECVSAGLIKQTSKTDYLIVPLDVKFNSLPELITYLSDVKNQDNYLSLKGQLEKTK